MRQLQLVKQMSLVVNTIAMTKATGIIKMPVVKTLLAIQTIDGVRASFREDGKQIKGQISIGS